VSDRAVRLAALEAYHADQVIPCTRCALAEGRTQVVVGSGSLDADVMFVGEAPGYHEDKGGVPFVGAAGKLLDGLLEGIGLTRADVFVANVLKCRPPGNRDPQPAEIAACEGHLFRQVTLIRPKLLCTLGNFATKLLSGRPDGISRVHGHELPIRVGDLDTLLYPLFHPAAALYTRSMLSTLEEDFARIPGLVGGTAPAAPAPAPAPVAKGSAQPAPRPPAPAPRPAQRVPEPPLHLAQPAPEPVQLGLF
jgi:DNA polymerase